MQRAVAAPGRPVPRLSEGSRPCGACSHLQRARTHCLGQTGKTLEQPRDCGAPRQQPLRAQQQAGCALPGSSISSAQTFAGDPREASRETWLQTGRRQSDPSTRGARDCAHPPVSPPPKNLEVSEEEVLAAAPSQSGCCSLFLLWRLKEAPTGGGTGNGSQNLKRQLPTGTHHATQDSAPEVLPVVLGRWLVGQQHCLLFGLLLAGLAQPCPAPCQCFGSTTVFCTEEFLMEVPEGIPPNATQLLFVATSLEAVPSRALTNCSSLASLAFLDNPIHSVAEASFAGLPLLAELDISASQLTALPSGAFLGLANLSRLAIKFSPIDTLEEGLFNHTPRLEALHLLGNRIGSLPPHIFRPLRHLRTLDVSQNRLATVPEQLFAPLLDLQVLKLSDNNLSSLPPTLFSPLTRLQELFLDGNALTELPLGIFSQLACLRQLHLQRNALQCLQPSIFPPSLPSLAVLNLASNQLAELPEGLLDGTPHLTKLSLASNQLQQLPERFFGQLSKLSTLLLSHNRLHSLPSGVFQGLPALTRLDLAHNSLTVLPREGFANLTGLEVLDIAHNHLRVLPEGIFDANELLHQVSLKGNPWACDCRLAYLAKWLQDTELPLNSQAFCWSPASLKGRDLPTVPKEQLVCPPRDPPEKSGCRAKPQVPSGEADSATPWCTSQDATGAAQLLCDDAGACHQLLLLLPSGEGWDSSGQMFSGEWSLEAGCGGMPGLRLRVSLEKEEPLQG
ncbi:carboxypeptidase N subunit 2 [Tiliqua scincoides]|uniref:carboxypeptidase N subunit 2 n=1 Tax=Tiliqua scincoides TaxID=71010 RepID=UPI0034627B8C